VLLLGPLVIGLFAGGRWSIVSLYVVVAALSAFLVRQPITMATKAFSGRRGRDVLPAVWFWIGVYGAIGLLHVVGLVLRGFGYLLYLAIAGLPVFAWYLSAAFWVGVGRPDPTGWLLWALTWAQSSASIVHAYLRLEQRVLERSPDSGERWRMGRTALLVTSLNLVAAGVLGIAGSVPRWIAVPFAAQWIESLWGVTHPAIGAKPRAIGYRQLAVSTLFVVLFVLAWR
jgi:hypothetical protein